MAGYTMIYRRAFKVGDRISIENLTGGVQNQPAAAGQGAVVDDIAVYNC